MIFFSHGAHGGESRSKTEGGKVSFALEAANMGRRNTGRWGNNAGTNVGGEKEEGFLWGGKNPMGWGEG